MKISPFIKLVLSTFFIVAFAYAQPTSYFQNFSGGSVPAQFQLPGAASTAYALSVVNQELKVVGTKATDFDGINIVFPGALDLSKDFTKNVSFDIRTDTNTRNRDFLIRVDLLSGSGSTGDNNTAGNQINANTKTIYATSKSRRVSFNFSDLRFRGNASFTAITRAVITIAPNNQFTGTIFLDNIAVGGIGDNTSSGPNNSVTQPYFVGIPDQATSVNSTERVIKIMKPTDGTGLTRPVTFTVNSDNQSLFSSISFSGASFPSNRGAIFTNAAGVSAVVLTGANGELRYTTAPNTIGTAVVTVSAMSTTTIPNVVITPSVSVFKIVVRNNIAPSMKPIPTLFIGSNQPFTYDLEDISNNNPEATQLVSITGASSDQSIIPNAGIAIAHLPGGRLGKVTLNPVLFSSGAPKTVNINFTLNDGGDNALGGVSIRTISVPVVVYATYYNPPFFNFIRDNEFVNTVGGPETITVSGVSDGNGGANIASITAKSSNPSAVADPVINYTPGNSFFTMTYDVNKLANVVITVTATNTGALPSSNGNSSFSRSFKLGGSLPQITGYTEPFNNTIVRGATYYGAKPPVTNDNDFISFLTRAPDNENWFVEGQGSQITLNVDNVGKKAVFNYNKPGSVPQFFAGVWYTPRRLLDLRNNRRYSFIVASSQKTRFNIDMFDVNGNRYGLIPTGQQKLEANTPITMTGCFTNYPDAKDFDFARVFGLLFNVPHPFNPDAEFDFTGNGGTLFNGVVTITNLRIGDQAPDLCPVFQSKVTMDSIPQAYHFSDQAGVKRITLTGVNAGATPNGTNPNPVSLSFTNSNAAVASSVSLSSVVNGSAVLEYTTSATTGTAIISISGTAINSSPNSFTFTVNTEATPSISSVLLLTINSNLNSNFPDGFKGQTMEGLGHTINTDGISEGGIVLPQINPNLEWGVEETGASIGRIAVLNGFESTNDNTDPNIINKDGFNYELLKAHVRTLKAYQAAGIKKYIASSWGHPAWMKLNKEYKTKDNSGNYIDNTLDSTLYNEVVEFYVAYVQAMKESGIELYALSFANEPQFNQQYPQTMINREQFVAILIRLGRKFDELGINTLIFGPETLPAQEVNTYSASIFANNEARKYLSGYAIHNYDTNGSSPDPNNANPGSWNTLLRGTNGARDSRSSQAALKYFNNPQTEPGSTGNGDGTTIPLWQTETSGYAVNWRGGMTAANVLHNSLVYGNMSLWTYWTPDVLQFDNTQQLKPVGVTSKHFFKYIRPGARRIMAPAALAGNNLVFSSAFRNTDQSIAVVILNNSNTFSNISVPGMGASLPSYFRVFQSYAGSFWKELSTTSGIVSLPPNSITTLWGGTSTGIVLASNVTVTPSLANISVPGGKLQLSVTVLPANASDKKITWSLQGASGNITQDGLFTAGNVNEVVTVLATNLSSGIVGHSIINVSGVFVPVSSITVTGSDITSASPGTSQMTVAGSDFLPSNATNPSFVWSVENGTGAATISGSGLLKGLLNGVVTVTARVFNNSTVLDHHIVNISGLPATSLLPSNVFVFGGLANIITIDKLPLVMYADVNPVFATNKDLNWSVLDTDPEYEYATISVGSISGITSTSGINNSIRLTPQFNGVVTVVATSISNPAVSGFALITITGQNVPLVGFTMTGAGGVQSISVNKQPLQLNLIYRPVNPNTKDIVWQVISTNNANIADHVSATGLYSPYANGIVTIVGTPVANSSLARRWVVTVTNQGPRVITVAPAPGNNNSITGVSSPFTLLEARILPAGSVGLGLNWSIEPNSTSTLATVTPNPGAPSVVSRAEVKANANGTINVRVSAENDPDVFTISQVIVRVKAEIAGPSTITGSSSDASVVELYAMLDNGNPYSPELVTWTVTPEEMGTITSNINDITFEGKYDGIATVSGTFVDMPGLTIEKKIQINLPARIRPTGIIEVALYKDSDLDLLTTNVIDGYNIPVFINAVFTPQIVSLPDMNWFSSDSSIVYVDVSSKNKLLSKGNGIATITGISQFNPSVTTSFEITVINASVTSINTNVSSREASIYPNPSNDIINISTEDKYYDQYLITNSLGVIVGNGGISSKLTLVSVQQYPKGIYTLTLKGKQGVLTKKISIY